MNKSNESDIFSQLWNQELHRVKTEHLLEYGSLNEKRTVFGECFTIDSGTEFFDLVLNELPELLKGKKVVYRGISEAKHRLFNKAQRAYAKNKKVNKSEKGYHESILQMIANARTVNNAALSNFLKSSGLKDTDISILSFLQHYNAPTPLMDWTTDLYVALYFSISSLNDKHLLDYYNKPFTNDINDYFSFYLLIEDHILGKVQSFGQLSMNSKSAVSYNTLRKKPLHYINEKFKSGKPVFSLANNLHIANQKGLFIYNNSSKLPFEEVILKNWTLHFIGNMSQGRKMFRTPLICFNFHKSIGYSLKRKLTEIGIIKENIFSKPETIARKAVPNLLNTLK